MAIDFKKNDKGIEEATISKQDFDNAINEAVKSKLEEAKAKEGEEKNVVETKSENSKYAELYKELRELKKEQKANKEAAHRSLVKDEYLKQGGNEKYFDEFYSANRFDKSENLQKDLEDIKVKKPIFFGGKQNFTLSNKDLGKEEETNQKEEEVVDNNGFMKIIR